MLTNYLVVHHPCPTLPKLRTRISFLRPMSSPSTIKRLPPIKINCCTKHILSKNHSPLSSVATSFLPKLQRRNTLGSNHVLPFLKPDLSPPLPPITDSVHIQIMKPPHAHPSRNNISVVKCAAAFKIRAEAFKFLSPNSVTNVHATMPPPPLLALPATLKSTLVIAPVIVLATILR